METVTTSKRFSINVRDLIHGLILSVSSAVLTAVASAIQTGGLSNISWESVGSVAAITAVTYLSKKFVEPEKEITTTEK